MQCAGVISRDRCLRDADSGERHWLLIQDFNQAMRQVLPQRLFADRLQQPFGVRRLFMDPPSFRLDITRRLTQQNLPKMVWIDVKAKFPENGSQLKFDIFIALAHEVDKVADPGTVGRCIPPVNSN